MANDRFIHATGARLHAPCGSRKRDLLERIYDRGTPCIRKVGETDLQDFIDSFADECDINRIVQRYAAGDVSVLQRVQGVYADYAGTPSDLTSAFEVVKEVRAIYESADDAVKAAFPSLGDFLKNVQVKPAETVKKEVVENVDA